MPLLVWAGFFVSRMIDFSGSAVWIWLGLTVASLVCTPPLIVYTLRCVRQPVAAWRKMVMVAGVAGGLLTYLLPLLMFLRVGGGALH